MLGSIGELEGKKLGHMFARRDTAEDTQRGKRKDYELNELMGSIFGLFFILYFY